MRAVVVHSFANPSEIKVEDVSAAPITPGHVRVRVHAVGCGFPDALIIAGKYQAKMELPFTPGTEFAGVVTEMSAEIEHFRLGMRVLGTVTQGAMAEECVVPVHSLARMPEKMSMREAAAFLVNYGTTYHALKQRANLRPGETLLVVGATGGTGIAAIELGKALGGRVLAGVGSDEKLALATQHGADAAFNYSSQSIKEAVATFSDGKGIDVVYDPVGSALAEQCVRAMAWNGRYLVIGFAGGSIPSIPLNLPLLKGCAIIGVFWGAHTRREPALHANNMRELFELFEQNKLRPEVTSLRGLDSIQDALQLLEQRRARGKLVLHLVDESV